MNTPRDGNGIGTKIPIPANVNKVVEKFRQALMESVAETDENLMNKYFENGELSEDEIITGLAKGLSAGSIISSLIRVWFV